MFGALWQLRSGSACHLAPVANPTARSLSALQLHLSLLTPADHRAIGDLLASCAHLPTKQRRHLTHHLVVIRLSRGHRPICRDHGPPFGPLSSASLLSLCSTEDPTMADAPKVQTFAADSGAPIEADYTVGDIEDCDGLSSASTVSQTAFATTISRTTEATTLPLPERRARTAA